MRCLIHGARGSGSSIPEAICAEFGIDYETRDLDVCSGEHHQEAHIKRHPLGKMPVLELEDGEILTDTAAIILTLDERHGTAALLPPNGSKNRAQAIRWMMFAATELYPLVELMDHPERFVSSKEVTIEVRGKSKELWKSRWKVVEEAVVGSPFLVSNELCAADIYLAALSRWDLDADWRREHLPRIESLSASVWASPRLTSVFERHFPSG